MMHGREKSDSAIVAGKSTNKAVSTAAEPVERRAGTKGNASQQSTHRTQRRVRVSQALERVRACFAVITQGGSRVREFRLHGSGRGAVSNGRPYRTSMRVLRILIPSETSVARRFRSAPSPSTRAKGVPQPACDSERMTVMEPVAPPVHSGCIPAALARTALEAISSLIRASNCSDVIVMGLTLTAASFSRTLAVSSAFNVSSCSLLIMARGVRLGANRPIQKV